MLLKQGGVFFFFFFGGGGERREQHLGQRYENDNSFHKRKGLKSYSTRCLQPER